MAVTDIQKTANFIIRYCHDHGDPITPLKLQKLLYYSQAWHLALYDEPLFDEDMETWIHGPANSGVYKRFEKYSYKQIDENPEYPELPLKTKKHIVEVLRAYNKYSAIELETMAVNEEPYRLSADGSLSDVPMRKTIKKELMKNYYRN